MAGRIDIALKWFDHGRGRELPKQQPTGVEGVDLLAALDVSEPLHLAPGKRAVVPCGFAIALPEGYEAQVRPRSGLASKYGVSVLNSPGTIDADYRGEVKVILINLGEETFEIRRGDRIAQMVVSPVSAVGFSEKDTLNETERGSSGFGSTGRKPDCTLDAGHDAGIRRRQGNSQHYWLLGWGRVFCVRRVRRARWGGRSLLQYLHHRFEH